MYLGYNDKTEMHAGGQSAAYVLATLRERTSHAGAILANKAAERAAIYLLHGCRHEICEQNGPLFKRIRNGIAPRSGHSTFGLSDATWSGKSDCQC